MAQNQAGRDQGLDAVRALAIVMVLVIHSTTAGLAGSAVGTADWWGALAWSSLARPAVPLFFMCSGALMLCRDISPRRLLTHNLPRILCAMFAWAFLYRFAALVDDGFTMEGLWDAAWATLLFQHEFHFYYLHILLLVYAFLPAVRTFVRGASRREEAYLLGLWFVTGILFPLARSFWPLILIPHIAGWYTMNMAFSAIGYALLGHYLRQYGGTVRRRWYILSLAGGLALTFGGSAAASLRDGVLNEAFLEGMSPGPMLMALGLFGLVLSGRGRPAALARAAGRLSRASFCIYLSHILFLRLFNRLGISPAASPCLLSIPLVCALLLASGWLTWEVLHRIPIVKAYLV